MHVSKSAKRQRRRDKPVQQQDVAEIPGSSSGVQCATVDGPLRVTCVPGELGAAGSAGKFFGCCHKGHSFFQRLQRLQRHRNSGGSRQMLMPCCRSCNPVAVWKAAILVCSALWRHGSGMSHRASGIWPQRRPWSPEVCLWRHIGERCNKDIWNKVAEEIDRIHNSTRCCRPASIKLLLSRRHWGGS